MPLLRVNNFLFQTIQEIGPLRIRGISSDSTGNTAKARRLLSTKYPWIAVLPDPGHVLSLFCKDISSMLVFKKVNLSHNLSFSTKTDHFH
jgi:hypothetical protein